MFLDLQEYYSALKGNELSRHKKKQRKFKCLLLREKLQSEKATCMIPVIWHYRKDKTIEIVKRLFVAWGSGAGGKGWIGGAKEVFEGYFIWYCTDGYMTWCFCQTQRSVKHKEWTLM